MMNLFSWFKRKPDAPFSETEPDKTQEEFYNEALEKAIRLCEENKKPKPRIGAAAQILSSYILKNYDKVLRISHYQVDDWSETAIYDVLGHQWRFDWYSERAIEYYRNGAAPTGFREYLAGQNMEGLFSPEESLYVKNACIEAIARQERDIVEFQRQEILRLGEQQ